MKILLTGSSGFLGCILYNILNKSNSVYTLSRYNADYLYDLEKYPPVFNNIFDLVIHSAGKAHLIPLNDVENDVFFRTNVIGTNNLLKGLLNNKLPKQFVFISSVSVYGLISGLNIDESAPLLAEDPYGKSKIEAEQLVKKWCNEHNVICTILRLPLIVGANPPGNLELMIRGLEKGFYFNIASGNANKSMVLGDDIAKFILKAAQVGGTFNLTDGVHPTFNELSSYIARELGKKYIPNLPLFIAKLLAKFGDLTGGFFPFNSNKLQKIISTLTFDDRKARITFGWEPTPVLKGFKLK